MDHIETAILNCYGIREAEQLSLIHILSVLLHSNTFLFPNLYRLNRYSALYYHNRLLW